MSCLTSANRAHGDTPLPNRSTLAPTFADIEEARARIADHTFRTPLRHYPSLSELIGAEIWVKHENFQILGAFKVRGGINLVSQLSGDELAAGLITASSGNHGQSIAFAAKTFGAPCVIVVPEGANPDKVRSIRDLGADVVFYGEFYDFSRAEAARLAREEGYRYVDAADEPALIAGVATYSSEIFEDLNDIDTLIVPVGAGSGASGACIVREAVSPSTEVIGVQSSEAPAAQISWKTGVITEAPMATDAEGLATGTGFEVPQAILRELLNDFVLVSDADISAAVCLYLEHTHTLVEGAGAAALAGAVSLKDRLAGKRVVLIASGANLAMRQLRQAVDNTPA
ncbi:MAG: threonine/serine dehydratase [Chloroflexi bacterium]|nr:threonine/serine dehydratase [Chloroflexota bacterium]